MKKIKNLYQDYRQDRTHFGFRDVSWEEKSSLVGNVFDSVAYRYDLMNDLMSGGMHRLWKASLIDQMRPRDNMHLLDVAGGTGDIASRFCRAGGGWATVCDINHSMITAGRDRAINHNTAFEVRWLAGDAERLPLPDRAVDIYTIAFGLRNVSRLEVALEEAWRVLRPGGRFFCLEFSWVASPLISALYDRFSYTMIPLLGRFVAQDQAAYRYLVESIRMFPTQRILVEKMKAAGFERVGYRNMSGGIVAIHDGWRL